MARHFAEKLRLTAKALGCVTHKELYARFREVNPQTRFELGNSYKWITGRATPRSSSVYDDWARVLNLEKSGQFLADCTLDEFMALLVGRYEIALSDATPEPHPVEAFSIGRMLQGRFAVYTLAWSKAARGAVIRGCLDIAPGHAGGLTARYSEMLPGGRLSYAGRGYAAHRALQFFLEAPEQQSNIFLSCHVPAPPGNVLLGLMAGSAYHDPQSRPMAARMLCIRQLHPGDWMETRDCYLGAAGSDFIAEVGRLGYRVTDDTDVGALCASYLLAASGAGSIEVSLEEADALVLRLNYQLVQTI